MLHRLISIYEVYVSPTLVSSPDLLWCVDHFQCNAHMILKVIRAGVGFGSGTKTCPTLNGNPATQCFECGDASVIHD